MNTQHTSACLLVVAMLLAGCGGGGSAAQSGCSLGGTDGCGGSGTPGGTGSTPAPDPAATVAGIELVSSSAELPSAGLAGSEVTITALVKNAGNVGVSGAPVQFSVDSGFLSVAGATSDAAGKASARLGTGGSRANRAITVTARVGGKSATTVVNVTGTRITVNAPAYVAAGASTTLTATLLDSAGRPIAGQAVTVAAKNGNGVSAGAATDSNGQVAIQFNASTRGSEQLTLSALGASASKDLMVGGSDVTLSPAIALDGAGGEVVKEVAVGTCSPIDGNAAGAGGSVTLTASRGLLYQDAACTQPLAGALALAGGSFPRTYIKSANAGLATIDAVLSNGTRGSTRIEFVATLLPSSRVSLQPELAVLGSGERSTLIAVVRDGTAANNLVKGATVQFSILADPSGGNLLSPFSAVTGSDGVARAVFVAGPADGGKDGTLIQARVAGLDSALATTALTVNKKALSIQFGTGNSLVEYSPAVFQQDYAVFVSDSAGNPVKDVAISVAAWPTHYSKGVFNWKPDDPTKGNTPGRWAQLTAATCANEDTARKGLYEPAFDGNSNGLLDPGIPLSASASGKTDALGMTTVSLRYPRDRAYWVRVELTVTGTVAGTESLARYTSWLPGLGKDYVDPGSAPPGQTSPYGRSGLCTDSY